MCLKKKRKAILYLFIAIVFIITGISLYLYRMSGSLDRNREFISDVDVYPHFDRAEQFSDLIKRLESKNVIVYECSSAHQKNNADYVTLKVAKVDSLVLANDLINIIDTYIIDDANHSQKNVDGIIVNMYKDDMKNAICSCNNIESIVNNDQESDHAIKSVCIKTELLPINEQKTSMFRGRFCSVGIMEIIGQIEIDDTGFLNNSSLHTLILKGGDYSEETIHSIMNSNPDIEIMIE